MTGAALVHTRTCAGIWEGLLTTVGTADDPPEISVKHRETPVDDVSLTPVDGAPGQWHLRFPVPVTCISDGVETILVTEARTGDRLGSYTVISGRALEQDYRAELDLLRAELDLLKRAFRRHCLEASHARPTQS